MKRFEKIKTEEELKKQYEMFAKYCDNNVGCKGCKYYFDGDSEKCFLKFLLEDIKTKKVPRIETINNKEKLKEEYEAYRTMCDSYHEHNECYSCKYFIETDADTTASCFLNYLAEEIEVEK